MMFLPLIYGLLLVVFDFATGLQERDTLAAIQERVSVLEGQVQEKCQSGATRKYHYESEPEWPIEEAVHFDPPFKKPPVVSFGITYIDVGNYANIRSEISVRELTKEGMNLVLGKYFDTHLFGLEASWMACPQ